MSLHALEQLLTETSKTKPRPDELAKLRTRRRLEQSLLLEQRPNVEASPNPPADSATKKRSAKPVIAAVFGMAAAVGLGLWQWHGEQPTAFLVVSEGTVARPGTINELLEDVSVNFADQQRLRIDRGSRGRVGRHVSGQIEFQLESGTVTSHGEVTRNEPWFVKAGPYSIAAWTDEVDVRWSPETEQLAVRSRSGRVELTGPKAQGVAVPVGRWFLMSPESGTPVEDSSGNVRLNPEGAEPDVTQVETIGSGVVPTEPIRTPPATCDGSSDPASSTELFHRARNCRRLGERTVAATLLRRIRLENPGTGDATRAALELGRLESGPRASRWLETYLSEATQGDELRREAMGLLMNSTHDQTRLRTLAREYLDRFPLGPEAVRAHAILDTQ